MKISLNSDVHQSLTNAVGPFIPGAVLDSVLDVEQGVQLTFTLTGGRDLKVVNALMAKLMRMVPKGTKLGPTRFAGKNEPFVITLKV